MILSNHVLRVLAQALANEEAALDVEAALESRDGAAPAVAATFTSVSPAFSLRATTAGAAGNSISLTGDGTSTVTALAATWNGAHPTNQVTVVSGGSAVPTNASVAQLSGGANAIAGSGAVSLDVEKLFMIMCSDEAAGAEMAAAMASGAQLSLGTSKRILIGMADSKAGNALINAIQTVPNSSPVIL